MSDFLCEQGYRAFGAANAGEAVSVLLSGEHIDAVITDFQMPGAMDGLDLACWIRDRYPDVPVLVVSGCRPFPERRGLDGVALVAKPFGYREIATRLTSLIGAPARTMPTAAANDSVADETITA